MTIVLYNCTAEKSRVNKSGYMTAVKTLTGDLLEGTSLTDPVITFSIDSPEIDNYPEANYALIAEFHRAYYISQWETVAQGLWRAYMHVDVLMSFKGSKVSPYTGIYALGAFVSRQRTESNPELTESMYPISGDASVVKHSGYADLDSGERWYGSEYTLYSDGGTGYRYIMQIQGKMLMVDSGASYYVDSRWPLATFVTTAAGMIDILNDISQGLTSSGTAAKYVASVYALPYPIDITGYDQVSLIEVPGGFNDIHLPTAANKKCYALEASFMHSSHFIVDISRPSLLAHYLNRSPYNSLSLEFLPFGKFELDTAVLFGNTETSGQKKMYLRVDTCNLTGDADLYYGAAKGAENIYLGSANVAVKFPISSEWRDLGRAVGGVVTTAASLLSMIATEGASAPAVIAAAAGTTNAFIAAGTANGSVTGGNITRVSHLPVVIQTMHHINSTAPDLYGLPCAKQLILGDLTGYTKVGDVHVEGINCTGSELDEIERLLKMGVIL